MKAIQEFLSGKKTYLVAIAAGLVVAAYSAKLIDEATHRTLLEVLGVGAVMTLRAAVSKSAA